MKSGTIETEGRLPLSVKLGFGVGDLGGNLFFTAMAFWSMIFLTDTVKIPAALAGIAVMIGKFWDAVTDPMMGYISDRSTFKMGRRRPYLIFGAIPLALAMWLFFSAPSYTDPLVLAAWAAAALCLLNTAYTVVNIPYSSLTPELTKDYNERMSLNGYRFGFAVIGTAIGATAVQPIVNMFPDPIRGFSAVGLLFGVLMALTALITGFSVRERPHDPADRPKGLLKTYLVVFKNRNYLLVVFAYAMHIAGMGFTQGILAYYMKYVYNDESFTLIALGLLLGVSMVFIPVSVLVSKRIGKKKTYMIFFVIMTIVTMSIFFFGHVLGPVFTLVMMGFAGVGVGFGFAPPYAMVPDTIEVEAKRTGQRREGAYYGMWTFMSKVGQSASSLILGLVLSVGAFVPNTVQGPDALFAIRLLVGPVPAVVFAIGAFINWRYPLDEKTYAAILAEPDGIPERQSAEGGKGGPR